MIFFDKIDPSIFTQLDFSHPYNMAANVQAWIDENNKLTMAVANEASENRKRMQMAMEQTAANTAEASEKLIETNENLTKTNIQLKKVVENQIDLIGKQKEQLEILTKQVETQENQLLLQEEELKTQRKQLEIQKNQLDILNKIFESTEDGVQVEKEIICLIQGQIDKNHPLWDYVRDKGSDVAIASVPVIYNALKMILISKGIILS